MNDRVRIYELAKRMNIANDDIIVALRQLGYDAKSHSSTVDSNTVGLLIAALNKKKHGQEEKTKTVKTAKAMTAKTVAAPTSPAKTPAPPPVVKPRVLSRYRPVPAAAEVVPGELESAPAATATAAHIVNDTVAAEPVKEVIVPAPQIRSANTVPSRTQAPVQPAASPQPPTKPIEELSANRPVVPESDKKSKSEAEPIEQTLFNTPSAVLYREEPTASTAAQAPGELKPLEEDLDFDTSDSMRTTVAPVPIRIAAPSIRATPPRPPKSHRPSVSERHLPRREEKTKPAAVAVAAVPRAIILTGPLTVRELADKMGTQETEVITRLMMRSIFRNVNQLVEFELAKELAVEMEYEILTEEKPTEPLVQEKPEEMSEADISALVSRPPVVTIMGHVDHGKTSLLDAIRRTKFLLTDSEAGGITQHIGAYHVEVAQKDGSIRQIVFLDTPGHEAFTAMRARGAKATDIAILVVAADDGVMPQTIEAIDHAKAAGVPIIVAVNKIDKAGADPERVLTQLMEHGVVSEKYGGDTVTCNVSAKKQTGLDELLEMILLVADILELKANPDKPAVGVIIEAELSRGKGAVATALVQNGTLKEADFIVAGSKSGRVRALFDDRGQRVKAAGPAMPVEVLGLDEVPQAGDRFEVVQDITSQRELVEQRKLMPSEQRAHHVTLESLHDMLERGEVKDLNVIIKADVQGTAEAIADSVRKLSGNEVQVRVLRTASGDISENDVNLAASSNAIIVGFNAQPDANAGRIAESAGVDIRTYSVIYQITDDLEKAIQGLIQPTRTEVSIGTAEVRQVFKVGKNLMIAGCMVVNGKIQRSAIAKIERGGQIIYEGKIETLKRFKDDAREVAQGFECGIGFEKFADLQEGDKVQAYIIQETKREMTRN